MAAKRTFIIPDNKPPSSEWFVEVDISDFLDEDTIQSVVFSAIRTDTGADVTSTVLDVAKNTNTTTLLKPWIQAGTEGVEYKVTMVVTTASGSVEKFVVKFTVGDI